MTKPAPAVPMLSPGQAAARLGVSTTTLRRWVDRGRIWSTRSPSNRILIREADVNKIVASYAGDLAGEDGLCADYVTTELGDDT